MCVYVCMAAHMYALERCVSPASVFFWNSPVLVVRKEHSEFPQEIGLVSKGEKHFLLPKGLFLESFPKKIKLNVHVCL